MVVDTRFPHIICQTAETGIFPRTCQKLLKDTGEILGISEANLSLSTEDQPRIPCLDPLGHRQPILKNPVDTITMKLYRWPTDLHLLSRSHHSLLTSTTDKLCRLPSAGPSHQVHLLTQGCPQEWTPTAEDNPGRLFHHPHHWLTTRGHLLSLTQNHLPQVAIPRWLSLDPSCIQPQAQLHKAHPLEPWHRIWIQIK